MEEQLVKNEQIKKLQLAKNPYKFELIFNSYNIIL